MIPAAKIHGRANVLAIAFRQIEIDAVFRPETPCGDLHQVFCAGFTDDGAPDQFARLVLKRPMMCTGAFLQPSMQGVIDIAD